MNNLSKFYIQHQNTLREYLLTFCYALFIIMCIWGAIEFTFWIDQLIHENQILKIELHEEKTALKTMFIQDELKKSQENLERIEYIKKWQQKNPDRAAIMNVTWKKKYENSSKL